MPRKLPLRDQYNQLLEKHEKLKEELKRAKNRHRSALARNKKLKEKVKKLGAFGKAMDLAEQRDLLSNPQRETELNSRIAEIWASQHLSRTQRVLTGQASANMCNFSWLHFAGTIGLKHKPRQWEIYLQYPLIAKRAEPHLRALAPLKPQFNPKRFHGLYWVTIYGNSRIATLLENAKVMTPKLRKFFMFMTCRGPYFAPEKTVRDMFAEAKAEFQARLTDNYETRHSRTDPRWKAALSQYRKKQAE